MNETPEDLDRLQQLLDTSYDKAGSHLREVITPERRLTAAQVAERLSGMSLLVLATVTKDGRPITGAVDGVFYRGAFHFGSSPESVRFKHIAKRPWVSAAHLPGEHLSITVHGRAELLSEPKEPGLRQTLVDIYGKGSEEFVDGGMYARIEADRMFTFHFDT